MNLNEGDTLICKMVYYYGSGSYDNFTVGKKYTITSINEYSGTLYILDDNGDEIRYILDEMLAGYVGQYFSTLTETRNNKMRTIL